MSLTITADTQELSKILGQVLSFTNDLSPVMSALGMEFESLISGRFETETDPLGDAWIPWKQSTVDNYPKGGNRRLLDCFGDMLGSLNHTADQNSATVGFGDPKAAYHEWGTEHMDRRGMIFADPDSGTLSQGDEDSLVKVAELFLSQSIGGF